MLGLGNTISSGSPVESLYSISFDGTDDYVDLGNVLDRGTGDFTISAWVKLAEATSSNIISKFQNADNRWFIRTNSNDKVQCYGIGGGSQVFNIESAVVSEDEWIHIVHTNDRSDGTAGAKVYINGSLSGSAGASATTDLDNTGNLYIGRQDGVYATANTKIDEVSIWDAALDAATVGTIYTKGGQHDLAAGRSIGTGNLVAYYRMGNGKFDDKANGVIHDQDINSGGGGFGSDVVTDGGFPSLDNWDELNATGANQVTLVDGTAKITYDHTVSAGALGIRQSGILVVGKTYRITMDVVSISGSGVKIYSGAEHAASIGTGPHVSYFVASSANFHIYRQSDASSSVTTLDNIVIRQLNGIPGLTSDADESGFNFSSDTP